MKRTLKDASLGKTGLTSQKKRDSAALLPLLGVLLFVTPLISVVTSGNNSFPLPNTVIYIFGAWLLLIVFSFLLARVLKKMTEQD
jgi:hypothetical protein